MNGHALVVRLDSMGDMLICGPAIRAVAASADRVSVLAGPEGVAAARLLPGVDDVLSYDCPWIRADPAGVEIAALEALVDTLRGRAIDSALILTSFHQSALPTALALRMAGIPRICAVSEDYPGALLDVRIPDPGETPEPVRMAAIAAAAGSLLPAGDDGKLAVRIPVDAGLPPALEGRRYVVVHPGATAPARTYPPAQFADVISILVGRGDLVAVTGSAAEAPLTSSLVAIQPAGTAVDLAGALDLAGLAQVLAHADAVIVGNTGPAHLAAAVQTPVVSLFSPVVPAIRWAPYGVPTEVLGDQFAACRQTRARVCPTPGHPCLSGVAADVVVAAVDRLRHTGRPLVRMLNAEALT